MRVNGLFMSRVTTVPSAQGSRSVMKLLKDVDNDPGVRYEASGVLPVRMLVPNTNQKMARTFSADERNDLKVNFTGNGPTFCRIE